MAYIDEYLRDFTPTFIPEDLVIATLVTTSDGHTEYLTVDEFQAYYDLHADDITSTALIFDVSKAKKIISSTMKTLLGE